MLKPLDHYWYSTNVFSLLLLPLAGLFCSISYFRSKLYRTGVLKSYRAPVPVVVIGNISVGGTGKTPLIIELVKQLQSRGKKPGVISRGYGGKATSWPQVVDHQISAALVGDEPKLIYQHTACPMVVGPDRKQDVELLLSKYSCDIVLSDDGMQHYALQRDIEIAVVDAQRLFGNRLCLPSGPLREPVSRLKSVDLVLYNGATDDTCGFVMQAKNCQKLISSESVPLTDFKNQTVHAVAGIGNPQRFFNMLTKHGLNVIAHVFVDHHDYQVSDLKFEDELPVLMTEKDAVKCKTFNLTNHWSVPIDIKLSSNAQVKINQLIDSIDSFNKTGV